MNLLRPHHHILTCARTAILMFPVLMGSFNAIAQTASDGCSYGAGSQYTVNSSCTFQDFDKPGSFGGDITATGCNGSNNDDAFGWFTATYTSTTITFDPDDNNHDPIIHLYTGACPTPTYLSVCADANGNGGNETITYATTIGVNYLVRIQRDGTNQGMNGRLCVWSPTPPANDDPCAAVSLTVNSTCSTTAATNTNATATGGGIPAPGCGSYTGGDVWFTFVAPANGDVSIETSANGLNNSDIALYSATACGGTFTLIECDDTDGPGNMGGIFRTGLTPGQTYYVRVWGNGGATGTFNICVVSLANDDPCGAVSLTVNSTCSSTATTNAYATTTGAGIPAPGCASFTTGDVWYTFVAPASGNVDVQTAAGGLNNTGMALYSATACGGTFTLIECDDDDGPGSMAQIIRTGLTPGQTYYVRVWGFNGASGTFNICVVDAVVPANDNPCGAVSLTVNGSCSLVATTNAYATATGGGIPAPGCAGYSTGDVWYTFVAPANGIVNLETTSGGLTDSGMALYSATACGGTFTLIECDNDDGPSSMSEINRTGLTPGQTYYVRMWGNGGGGGTFNICAWSPIPPVNDDPCGAISLSLGTSCSLTSYSSANATSTSGVSAPGCGNYSNGDVWFSFVAPTSGAVAIRTSAGSITNLSMALYTATACNGTFTLIECDDNDGVGNMPFLVFSSADLVSGQTYYLRVWQNGGGTGTFNLCANTAPAAAGGECLYTLRLSDSQGDGWGGSTVSVQIGASPATNYTLSNGDQEVAYFNVPTGQIVQISYSAAGGNQNEISYFLHLGVGILYSDGPTPGTGLRYASAATCAAPAPPPSDCWGGAMICNSQLLNDSPNNNAGVKTDLTVDNRGCLSTEERQGKWYSFTPSASGTIEFTISPTNASDDYDFAIWGPSVSAICPPVGPPYRCNYSGTPGNTGLSTAASNDSEGGGGPVWSNEMVVTTGQVYVLYISNFSRSGLAFTLTWNLTNGASLDCMLLPVELTAFDGEARDKDVVLNWVAGSEMNSAYYNVERSLDGQSFSHLGTVAAAGSSAATTGYEFVDNDPSTGLNYYRLVQVDLDGTSKFSNVEAVVFRRSILAGLPYPNPASDHVNLDLQLGMDDLVEITIHDASGRIVWNDLASYTAGVHRVQAPLTAMDAGSYELVVHSSSGEVLHAGRFIVQ